MNKRTDGEELIATPVDVDAMSAEDRMKLGPLIHGRRVELGMSMLELSEAAGVDRKTLRTIENGMRAGQPAKLRALLEALDIPQAGDFDRFSERTRSFIFATAPIFEQLRADVQDDAQNDVVVLLAGKLNRSAGIPVIGVGGSLHDLREVANETIDETQRVDDSDFDGA